MASNGRKIQEQILALLGSLDYRPLDKSELAKALGRKSGVRMGLNQAQRTKARTLINDSGDYLPKSQLAFTICYQRFNQAKPKGQ